MTLRPFQKRFIKRAFADGIDTAVLSVPRAGGKSALGGVIMARAMTPGDPLHEPGKEYILVASSLEQARIVFNFVRAELEGREGYRYLDSVTRIGITHTPSNTRLRVLSSKGKSAFGIVGCPLLIFDEPGSLEVVGGQLLADAIFSAQGKPGSNLRVILLGTLAPSSAGWWHDLVKAGSTGSVYVQALRGDPAKWDSWAEIKRCNPLTAISSTFRAKLKQERDAARRDSRLKARFLSYRLNVPSGDESTMLLTVDDYEAMTSRAVPERVGRPIVAVDLGSSRAFSAAVSLYENGRVEARALCPGLPSIEDQERRDLVPAGTYQSLCDAGVLVPAVGLRVPPAKLLVTLIKETWGTPSSRICDRFRLADLYDAGVPCRVIPRVTRWSESAADIRSLRAHVKDGPFSISPDSRSLLQASLSVATVRSDDAGSVRLIKKGTNNTSRDDIAQALVLASGLFERSSSGVPRLTLSRTPF